MIDMLPRHQLGYMTPVQVADAIYYQFYRICPSDVSMVGFPLNLQAFTGVGVDKALEQFWQAFDFLVAREVDRISLGGIPLSAYATRPRIMAMLEEAAKKSSIATTTDFEESIVAIKHLNLKKVAVAAKWPPDLMQKLVEYLTHAGVTTAGVHGEPHTAQQVVGLKPQESIDVAMALGRDAFRKMPDADGLLLAGGAWFVMHAVPRLEQEFGRPVITNPGSTYWSALKQFGRKAREPGFGMIIDKL
jgi:maleate cis-trans isomerase